MDPHTLATQLAQFTGSTTFTRHGLVRSLLMTEGVAFLADQAGAHWLTDTIASYQHEPVARAEPFQAWSLVVDAATRSAVLTMTDGNSSTPIIRQQIDWTDFLLAEIALWAIAEGDHRVIMLPSEY
jgi:acyl transferase domain-containing protein